LLSFVLPGKTTIGQKSRSVVRGFPLIPSAVRPTVSVAAGGTQQSIMGSHRSGPRHELRFSFETTPRAPTAIPFVFNVERNTDLPVPEEKTPLKATLCSKELWTVPNRLEKACIMPHNYPFRSDVSSATYTPMAIEYTSD
jgi:hypothetical protein